MAITGATRLNTFIENVFTYGFSSKKVNYEYQNSSWFHPTLDHIYVHFRFRKGSPALNSCLIRQHQFSVIPVSLYRRASSCRELHKKALVRPGWSTSWIVAAIRDATMSKSESRLRQRSVRRKKAVAWIFF